MAKPFLILDSLFIAALQAGDTSFVDALQFSHRDSLSALDTGQAITQHFISVPNNGPIKFNPQAINREHQDYLLIPLAVAFLLIAIARLSGSNIFVHMRKALASRPIFRQLLRDGVLLPKIAKLPLLLAYLIILSVFIFRLNAVFSFLPSGTHHSFYRQFFGTFGLLALFELGRYFVSQWLGLVFRTSELTDEFNSNTILYNSATSILLLPLLVFSVYSPVPVLVYMAVGVFVFFFILRLFRAFLIIFELRSYSGFQIFVYICTLEILPVFVFIKILTSKFTVV